MNVSAARFELALKELNPSDWERFERLSSVFLATDFAGLRTMASPGGDRGRDAELYALDGEPNTLFQFAVRGDWEQKIKETLNRLRVEFPGTSAVVFMSSQPIGAKADKVRKLAREQGVSLDVRDRSWFVERFDADDSRRNAAAELARVIVDPFLEQSGIIRNAPGVNGQDAKTALVFLELQAKDDDTAKGLTKSCYESLVRAALQGTTAERRKSRADVRSHVAMLLPQHEPGQLVPFVDAALKRLERSAVKHYVNHDDFHISHEEIEKTKDRIAGLALLQAGFISDVHDIVQSALGDGYADIKFAEVLIGRILETYFYRLGEEFAQSVAGGRDIPLNADLLKNVVLEIAPVGHPKANITWSDFLYSSILSLIASPSNETTELFMIWSTAYTLFAFLSEVPDVQQATKKLFGHGTLWFDTSVLLPIFAERAFPDDMRPFTDLMRQLRRAGLKLFVTSGVIEEIERHLNLCKHYLRVQNWIGRVPYVYQRYALAGGVPSRFNGWLEQFLGDHRPLDDLADFLSELAGIEASDLPSWDSLPQSLIDEVKEYWQSVQDNRRGHVEGADLPTLQLAKHDSENYLSVLAERRVELGKSVLGYTSWLVTMDSAAWKLTRSLSKDSLSFVNHGPVISLDFLIKYLSFGPRRDRVDTSIKGHSRVFTSTIYENIPADLIKAAAEVRESCQGLNERLVLRRIRDEMDKRRMSVGIIQNAGLDGLDAALASMF